MNSPWVAVLGTLDTKGEELGYVCRRLLEHGCRVTLIDAGVFDPGSDAPPADVSASRLAAAAGSSLEDLRALGDRGVAVGVMGQGARAVLASLREVGRLDGMIAVGGSGNAAIAAAATEGLPLGLPKLFVTTIAAGDTSPYVGTRDITLMYPVVDVAGLNRVSRLIFDNAAVAIAAMAANAGQRVAEERPALAATMFGVTTAGVAELRRRLEQLGYEVLTFHASGQGGKNLESLVTDGLFQGVADVTTTELADDLIGGVCSAGPKRLEAAVAAGLPQVVSVGALDMVNFGPLDRVPPHFRNRRLHEHNRFVTLMRTNPDECIELGRRLAIKLSATRVPVALFVPTKGLSAISVPGAVFFDPEADAALLDGIRSSLDSPLVDLRVADTDINNPDLAHEMADELDRLVRAVSQTR